MGIATPERRRGHHIQAAQLDALVCDDLWKVLSEPEQLRAAIKRARSGKWLPQQLRSRRESTSKALSEVQRQQQRLLDAYVAGALGLPEFERKRAELESRKQSLLVQARRLDATAQQELELGTVASGLEAFCAQVREGLQDAGFEQ